MACSGELIALVFCTGYDIDLTCPESINPVTIFFVAGLIEVVKTMKLAGVHLHYPIGEYRGRACH